MIKTLKKNLICFLFISFSALPLSASADWFLSAETKALIVKAEAGDAEAQIRVALAYDSGRGAPRDRDNATKWYRMHEGTLNVRQLVNRRLLVRLLDWTQRIKSAQEVIIPCQCDFSAHYSQI